MDFNLLIGNFLNPPILFFFLGFLAVFAKSDLEMPTPIPKILSLYLLFAIGLQDGVGIAAGGLQTHIIIMLGAATAMASVVPMSLAITFPFNIIAGMALYLAIINRIWSLLL